MTILLSRRFGIAYCKVIEAEIIRNWKNMMEELLNFEEELLG
jgi:hypothetical protein